MLLVMFLHSSVLGAIIFALWSAAFLAIILYLATGLLLIKAPPAVWIQLSAAPLFIFWKISVYLRMAYTGKKTPSEWVRTERHEMKK
jgi:hypothetical protein